MACEGILRRRRLMIIPHALTWCLLPVVLGYSSDSASRGERDTVLEAVGAASDWLDHPDRITQEKLLDSAAILSHSTFSKPNPQRIWITTIDTRNTGMKFAFTATSKNSQRRPTEETLSQTTLDFAKQHQTQIAFNTSAFDPVRSVSGKPMDVIGLASIAGKKYSDQDSRFGALLISEKGELRIEKQGQSFDQLWHAVPGFKLLIDDEEIVVNSERLQTGFGGPNPRTAIGLNKNASKLWIVIADGRQPQAKGLTLAELAAVFKQLGAWDALNLDGGGSTTLVIQAATGEQKVINSPIHNGRPGTLRPVANNMGIYLKRLTDQPRYGIQE